MGRAGMVVEIVGRLCENMWQSGALREHVDESVLVLFVLKVCLGSWEECVDMPAL
jgi:hypothetical protein